MKTLIAHEWVGEVGGGENVFEQFRLAVPHLRAVCLWNDGPTRFGVLEETWLARTPLRSRKAVAMPFMGSAWNRVELADIERVIVSSQAFSHHLASRAADHGIPAFAYVHSPARYVWAPDIDDRANSLAGRAGRSYFQRWDRRHVSKDVNYAANSAFVAERIADVWEVNATVIYPPVEIERIRAFDGNLSDADTATVETLPSEFVLGAGRFVRYKNFDAVIRAGELLDLPVVLAGAGPDEPYMRSLAEQARTPVVLPGRVSDNMLIELYRRASLFVHMAVEDFGITPVEAMACGTPVLINEIGGAKESVLAVSGGLASKWLNSRFEDPAVVEKAMTINMKAAMSAVGKFSVASFRTKLCSWVGDV
jgi:glycosyltransferase involved in cell wall biosynthesis